MKKYLLNILRKVLSCNFPDIFVLTGWNNEEFAESIYGARKDSLCLQLLSLA